MRPSRGLKRDRRGVISLELALIGSIVLLRLQLQLDEAMRGAFFYAWANAGAVTPSDVQTVAAATYTSTGQPTVTATITQYCLTASTGYPSTGTPATATNGTCANGLTLETYMSVTVQATYTPTFLVGYLVNNGTISVSGKSRIQ
jgi:hypothetical protein